MTEIRMNDALLFYWQKLEKNKDGVPYESEIDSDKLGATWDDCFLVQLTPDNKFMYDFLGKNLFEAMEDDISQIEEEDLLEPNAHRASEKFREIVKAKKPIFDEGRFRNSKGMMIKFRQQLLPFANVNDEVIHILGGLRWKAF